MAPRIHIYRNYRFGGDQKDPVIYKLKTLMQDENLKETHAALISDLAPATVKNWFDGPTRLPRFSSVAAFTRSLGYDIEFKKSNNSKLDIEAELKAAADYRLEQSKKKKSEQAVVRGAFHFK